MPNIRSDIQLFIQKELSPEANRKRLVDTARSALNEAQAAGKVSINYDTVVDGTKSSTIDSAQRSIFFRFGYAAEVAVFALSYLRTRAPHRSGKFANSFWVSVDGAYFAPGSFDPSKVQGFNEVVIGNTAPENRRVDVNYIGTRSLHYQSPGIYDDTIRAIRRQFGNVIQAKRVYDYTFPSKYIPTHKNFRFQSPAIIITPIT